MYIKRVGRMGFQLDVLNPFIITFHHRDLFPKGNGKMGPLRIPYGKSVGEDFDESADWRMYYGHKIPGFPVHPHRGFETVTVMLDGFADHFDSKGSKGRYGKGDVQWMTAAAGVQHSEMFPVLDEEMENPMELFQIWLNLPRKNKFANPDYKMFWNEDIPVVRGSDDKGKTFDVRLIAGEYKGIKALDPLPASWAYEKDNHVGIWLIRLVPGAKLEIPAVSETLNRVLYNYQSAGVKIGDTSLGGDYYAVLEGAKSISVENGEKESFLLLLEGEPIDEPVAASGPFVMNTQGELKRAYLEYQETEFGGWPWKSDDPVNSKSSGRFASYNFGERMEYPSKG